MISKQEQTSREKAIRDRELHKDNLMSEEAKINMEFEKSYTTVLEINDSALIDALAYISKHIYMLNQSNIPQFTLTLLEIVKSMKIPEASSGALKLLGVLYHDSQEELALIANSIDFVMIAEFVSHPMPENIELFVITALTFSDSSLEHAMSSDIIALLFGKPTKDAADWRVISAILRRFSRVFASEPLQCVSTRLLSQCKSQLTEEIPRDVAVPVLQCLAICLAVVHDKQQIEDVIVTLFPKIYHLFETKDFDVMFCVLEVVHRVVTEVSAETLCKIEVISFLSSLVNINDGNLASLVWASLLKCLEKPELQSLLTSAEFLAEVKNVVVNGVVMAKAGAVEFTSLLLHLSFYDDYLFSWFGHERIVPLVLENLLMISKCVIRMFFENLWAILRDLTDEEVRQFLGSEFPFMLVDELLESVNDESIEALIKSVLDVAQRIRCLTFM